MQKLQTVPTFLPNKGIVLDKPEEMLLEQFSPYSRNMEFYNELIQGRLGLTKFDTKQLNGRVMLIDQYWHFDYSWWLMVATTKDIYAYDFSNSRFDILTPIYNTGTIEIHVGDPKVVHGSGGMLWATNLKAGDWIKIGSGSIHTGSTWYEIDTVDSNTQVTLKTNGPTTAGGSAYVARQTFIGSDMEYWNSVSFQDKNLGPVWLALNGSSFVYWTGTGQVAAVTGLPTGFTSAKYISRFKDRVMVAWTVEGGQNQPMRERWSDVADCLSWQDVDLHDFVDEDTWIMGLANFNDYHVVFKEYEAYIGRFVGDPYTFDFEKSTTCVGCFAAQSIIQKKDALYYFGRDLQFHKWNLLSDQSISLPLFPETKDFDPRGLEWIYGWDNVAKHQIRWFCPTAGATYNDYTVTYDYENNILQVWEYEAAQACNCMGEYLNVEDLYVDDPDWGERYVDEEEGYWDDRKFLTNAAIVIYGGYDGYIRTADSSYLDDGAEYTKTFRSVKMNYGMPQWFKRLWKQEYWLEADTTGDITIKMRKDDDTAWSLDTKTVSLISTTKDIVKKMVTWDKQAFDFQIEISSQNRFALLGWYSYIFKKRMRK